MPFSGTINGNGHLIRNLTISGMNNLGLIGALGPYAQIYGIDPHAEDIVTGISKAVTIGSYLTPGDFDQVIIGQYMLSQYVPVDDPNFAALDNVVVGSKIRMKVGEVEREVTVKGIIFSKVDALTRNLFMVDSQFRSMIGRNDGNVDEKFTKEEKAEIADEMISRWNKFKEG